MAQEFKYSQTNIEVHTSMNFKLPLLFTHLSLTRALTHHGNQGESLKLSVPYYLYYKIWWGGGSMLRLSNLKILYMCTILRTMR